MAAFIQLTKHNGAVLAVNLDQVLYLKDGGEHSTTLEFSMDPETASLQVCEPLAEILRRASMLVQRVGS